MDKIILYDVEDKNCPLCHRELVSGLGCKMCGMLSDCGKFCCMKCEEMYEEIHESN